MAMNPALHGTCLCSFHCLCMCMSWMLVALQAAFGAPIGGVLFSMEEAATHWSRKMAWRCFLCTTVSVFTLAQLHPRSVCHPTHDVVGRSRQSGQGESCPAVHHMMQSFVLEPDCGRHRWKNGVLSFQGIADMLNIEWFQQFPFLVLVSMGGGLLGAAFNWLRKALLPVRPAWERKMISMPVHP